MTNDSLVRESLYIANEISNNPDVYITGVLLNDYDAQNNIEILAHMQSIIMQSLQVNNPKRAIKYIAAFSRFKKNHNSLADRLKNSATDYIIKK